MSHRVHLKNADTVAFNAGAWKVSSPDDYAGITVQQALGSESFVFA